MDTTIRQLLPCDMDAAIAFVRSLRGDGAAGAEDDRAAMAEVDHRVSLIASDSADAIIGLALCSAAPRVGEPYRLQINVSPQRPGLVRTLIDKALLKLHARGIHKCRIMLGDEEPNEIWHATRWLDHLPEGEPQAA